MLSLTLPLWRGVARGFSFLMFYERPKLSFSESSEFLTQSKPSDSNIFVWSVAFFADDWITTAAFDVVGVDYPVFITRDELVTTKATPEVFSVPTTGPLSCASCFVRYLLNVEKVTHNLANAS